jgi:MFS family permease
MLMACSPALVVDIFPPSERGRALGMVGTVVAAGLTSGPPLGGLIVDLFSWRLIFYINIPIGIVTAIFASGILKGGKGDISRSESFDWLGAILLAVCFCSFIIATTRIAGQMQAIFQFLLLIGISIASAVWFFRIETDTPYPIFDPSLLRIRLFTLPILAALILFVSLFAMVFLMPFYLVHPCGFSMNKAGFTMIIPFVFFFFVSPVSGTISDRIGSRMLCTVGMILLAAGLFSLSNLTASAGSLSIAWRLALVGIGTAVFIPPNSAAAMSAIPPQRRGIAGGTVATARNLGMVIGVAVAGLTFNTFFHSLTGGLNLKVYRLELEPHFMTAFQYSMLVGGAVAGAGAVISYLRGSDKAQKVTHGL